MLQRRSWVDDLPRLPLQPRDKEAGSLQFQIFIVCLQLFDKEVVGAHLLRLKYAVIVLVELVQSLIKSLDKLCYFRNNAINAVIIYIELVSTAALSNRYALAPTCWLGAAVHFVVHINDTFCVNIASSLKCLLFAESPARRVPGSELIESFAHKVYKRLLIAY